MRSMPSTCVLVFIALIAPRDVYAASEPGVPPAPPAAPAALGQPIGADQATLYYFYGAPSLSANEFTTFVSCTNLGGDKIPNDVAIRFELYGDAALVGSCSAALAANADNPTSTTFSIQNLAGVFASGCTLNTVTGFTMNIIRVITPAKAAPYIICEAKAYDTASMPFDRVVNVEGIRVGKKFKNPKDSKN